MPASRTPVARLGRRAVLRAGLGGVTALVVLSLAGCRLRLGQPGRSASVAPPEPTADQLAVERAQSRADGLAALYAEAARVRADIAPALRQLAADHTAHVAALRALTSGSGSTAASPATSTASSSATSGATGLTAVTAVSALSQAERSAVSDGLADLDPLGPQAARLLASIAACGSAHVAILGRLQRPGRTAATPTGPAS